MKGIKHVPLCYPYVRRHCTRNICHYTKNKVLVIILPKDNYKQYV